MCYSLWYNAPVKCRPVAWKHYTTICNTQSSAPENGQNNCPKYVDLIGIINKLLLLYLVGLLYYLQKGMSLLKCSLFTVHPNCMKINLQFLPFVSNN